MFTLIAQSLVAKIISLSGQTISRKRRFPKPSCCDVLAENLSRGNQFELSSETIRIPQGEFEPGDFVRLTGGGVIVQGSIADSGRFVLISSWVRPALEPEDMLTRLQSIFSLACRPGVPSSGRQG